MKRAIILGAEEKLVQKLRTFLSNLGFQVFTALHEEETVQMAKTLRPQLILCQFWEDEHILDAKKLAKLLSAQPMLVTPALYVYCKNNLALEAMKTFKDSSLITYAETREILSKLETLLKTEALV